MEAIVYQDDTIVISQTLSTNSTRMWKPTLVGSGSSRVEIYFDGRCYMVYRVDFDRGTTTLAEDYSGDF